MTRPTAPLAMRTRAGTRPHQLINQADTEWWPAWVVRAKSNHDARQLAQATWLLRDKRSGTYLRSAHTLDGASTPLANQHHANRAQPHAGSLLHALTQLNQQVPSDYSQTHQLPWVSEPRMLTLADFDRYQRPLWLLAPAAHAWQAMKTQAQQDGIWLEAISGYRSHAYQLGIIERKLARGQTLAEILHVNTAPGYSEHHSGRALDISSHGQPACEASFEHTDAHDWLNEHAQTYGFSLSYPKNNRHGIIHEPWHWCWHPGNAIAA